MNKKSLSIKRPYYKRILVLMTLFAVLILLPFSLSTYEIAKKNTMDSINSSNEVVLSQINYNYRLFSSSMSNICMELFLNYNTKQILYSKDTSYYEALAYTKQIAETTLMTNQSIDSIALYNNLKNEWYNTKADSQLENIELEEFVSKQSFIPKLQPVLRKTEKMVSGNMNPTYIFSYFMYEFSDPTTHDDSYFVLNQNANWFIDNIVNASQGKALPGTIYLLDQQGRICNNMDTVLPVSDNFIVNDYYQNHIPSNGDNSQYYTKKYDGETYLVTSILLGDQKNSIVMVQSFNDVFSDLISLRNQYIILGLISCLGFIVLLLLLSRKIYSPVQRLLRHISSSTTKGTSTSAVNEFEYLQNIYSNAAALNKKLLNQTENFEPMIEQYQLFNLIAGNTYPDIDALKKSIPSHWLVTQDNLVLSIILFKIDHFENNQYDFKDTDTHLILYAVRNIILELFEKEYTLSSFYYDDKTLALVVNSSGKCGDDDCIESIISNCQNMIKQALDITVSASYSDTSDKITDLPGLCSQATENIQYRYLYGPGNILNKSKCLLNANDDQTTYSNELDDRLTQAIKKKDLKQSITVIEDIKNSLYAFTYHHVTVMIMVLLNKINGALSELSQAGEISSNIKYSAIYKKAVESEFIDDFFAELTQYIKSALTQNEATAESKDALNISAIIDYIQHHYSDVNLSSQIIGSHLDLSSRYIMRKFKESTGSSLNEYIVSVRMRKAASLIKNTEYPISKIVKQIGIDSDTYFYKLFKKTYGCTPREFSEKHQADTE